MAVAYIKLHRAWINQPSTLQPHHKLHGKRVLAGPSDGKFSQVWFVEGDTIGQEVFTIALSPNWPKKEES